MKSHAVVDVSALPSHGFDTHAPLWWGNLMMIVIESTMMALVAATYFYLQQNFDVWPPPRAEETIRASDLEWTVLRPMRLTNGKPTGVASTVDPASKAPRASVARADLARLIARELADRALVGKMPVVHG